MAHHQRWEALARGSAETGLATSEEAGGILKGNQRIRMHSPQDCQLQVAACKHLTHRLAQGRTDSSQIKHQRSDPAFRRLQGTLQSFLLAFVQLVVGQVKREEHPRPHHPKDDVAWLAVVPQGPF
jgi:hypothetical protein